jgi:aspartyl-tRNA(Asn)/glutamyl-tRNA(Gln) amidotransferase subunit A
MLNDDVFFSSVRSLGNAIKSRQLSPIELTKAYLSRLEKIGPKLGAVVTITRELALQQAQAAETEIAAGHYRGPLHGIPYGAKDALAVKGFPTTWGTAPYRKQIFEHNATVINRLNDAGAVLIGKLAMLEIVGGFGFDSADASFTGPVRTPWNFDRWAGGSSSGPGAATAAGLVAFSLGSETGGSILNPSTYCGLAGMRPTYGRVSRYGAVALCWSLDKVGPMCRTADDCGLVMSTIAGYDPLDSTSIRKKFTYSRAEKPRKFKLAVAKGTYDAVEPEIKANFERSLKALSNFATIAHDVDFPDYPYGPMIQTIVNAEGASAFREIIDNGRVHELQNPLARVSGYVDTTVSAVDYLQAMRIRKLARIKLDELLGQYDALVAPTMSGSSGKVGESWKKAYLPPATHHGPASVSLLPVGNLAGIPGITVPNGFSSDKVPTGVQFVGKAWSEANLLAIADAYQQASDWHKLRPPMKELTARSKTSQAL